MLASMALAETRYATGTASAAVVFGPSTGPVTIESVYAASDKAGAALTVSAWNKAAAISPTAAATNGATVIAVANAAGVLTTNDAVAYVHADGTTVYRTISAATTSNVTLNAAITQAGTTADRIYELAAAGSLPFDSAGADVGTNKYAKFEGSVWRGLAPVYVALTGTSNAVLQVTTDR